MKKLILTGCAAILFGIGAIAQVQDDTSSINNNLREGVQETQEDVQQEGNELQRRTEQTGEEVKEDAQDAGNEIREGAERTGDEIQQGAEEAGDEIEQGAERTGEQIEQGADSAKERMDGSPSSQNNADPNATGEENTMGANSAQPPQSEIEVLEDKEGPNNTVVYKYQGELYYVDREQKKLVEIDESQLKDAEHKAIVSD